MSVCILWDDRRLAAYRGTYKVRGNIVTHCISDDRAGTMHGVFVQKRKYRCFLRENTPMMELETPGPVRIDGKEAIVRLLACRVGDA
ncbi:MAG: hypothetical protein AAB524_00380 [Patescibacteria group bacterium]